MREAPEHAVARAVDSLLAQGFVPGAPALEAELARLAPTWTTRVVEIGDDAATWRRGLVSDVVDVVTLGLAGRFVPRKVEKTWVVVTARPTADGTDVVLAPLAGRWGQADTGGTTAKPWVDAAAGALVQAWRAGGVLLREPTTTPFVGDRDCPAYPRTFRRAQKEVRARRA
ncbi:hypothetical protein GC089_12265 [Cellulomonas sp. JZ18]|uniref:hypothetical protein n=1 Tax=Cellulomonas sp. JZ18 TaxID=2654191 RepID=UPI0012D4BA3C|nr:hypothetical protein [Cellulomonas sp. JZ18]QGQ19850.1 hypothetical protein GC089_12265 [Cellulomonas sp. JZ18]